MIDAYAEHPDQIDQSPYAYVGNNPVDKTDPDGNCPPCDVNPGGILLGGVALAGGTIAVAAPTVVGEAIAIPAAVVEVTGAAVVAGVAWIWNKATSNNSTPKEPEPAPEPESTPQSTPDKLKGTNIPKVKDAIKTGQEAHRQEQKKLKEQGADVEVPMTLKDGTKVRKDAVMPDGTAVIIKPNTPSGKKSADKREEKMNKNGVPTQPIFYDPQNPAYQPGSSSYLGPGVKL